MWSRLAEHAHLVAIDLPGFGHSERRDDLLQPSTMAEFVVHVINDFGLERPHAVGPDIGTSTLLFAAAKYPSLLRSIVLGNGTATLPIQVGGALNDIVGAPDIEPFRKIDPRQGVDSVLALVERYKLPEHVREDFLSAYEGDRFVESLRFLQAYKTELPKLGKLLPTIMTPVQIITGNHDPGVLPEGWLRTRVWWKSVGCYCPRNFMSSPVLTEFGSGGPARFAVDSCRTDEPSERK
jgi:pimeloyl-ACP methyl ester carboxylesterase